MFGIKFKKNKILIFKGDIKINTAFKEFKKERRAFCQVVNSQSFFKKFQCALKVRSSYMKMPRFLLRDVANSI